MKIEKILGYNNVFKYDTLNDLFVYKEFIEFKL